MSFVSTLVRGIESRARSWSFAQASGRGQLLGRLAHAVDRRHRRVGLANLRAAFPERPEAWRRGVLRGAYEQVGRTAVETLWSPALTAANVAEVIEPDGFDRLRVAAEAGRGVLIASAHFGNWEVLAIALGLMGLPVTSVARPLDDPDLEALLQRLRTRTGNDVVAKERALRPMLRALGEGKILATLVDQNTQRHEAVFVPFFHDLAATTPVLGHLHLRTGAPIVPVFPLPTGAHYRLVVEEPITSSATDRKDAIVEITAAVTARIERRVRQYPPGWLWMHDRWRERPQ